MHGRGHRWVQQGPRGEKNDFCQSYFLTTWDAPTSVFLARFEPVVTRFGPPKVLNCLENGLFGGQKWVKHGSKNAFFEK